MAPPSSPPKTSETRRFGWVISHAYEGPDRRQRSKMFLPKKARLDDARVEPNIEAESMDTTLRRLSLWGNLTAAARDQRAKLLANIEALSARARAENQKVWPDILDAVARYLRAVGANGKIDEPLLNDALHAAHVAHVEGDSTGAQAAVISRLDAAARAPH